MRTTCGSAGLDAGSAGFGTSMLWFGLAAGSAVVPWLSDKMQVRKRPIIIGSVIQLAALAGLLYLPGLGSGAAFALCFVFGFAMIWYMWWLAILCLLAIFVAIVIRASDDDSDYVMPASEVKKIEDARFAELAKAPKNEMENEPGFAGFPAPEAST